MVNMQEKRTAKAQRSYSLMPGEVALSYQLGRDPMPVTDRSQAGYVLLEAVPTELMAQVRLPLNFSLVLDCSGSMHGSKIASVKEAVKMVIDNLSPDDYISVVTFTGSARTIVSAMPARDPGPGVLSDRRIVVPLGDLEKNNPPAVLVELLIEPRAAGLFALPRPS